MILSGVLKDKGFDDAGLSQIFMDEDLRNPFKGLQSSYMQKKAYKSIGLVVKEISVKLI
jgi:hypothetical protein